LPDIDALARQASLSEAGLTSMGAVRLMLAIEAEFALAIPDAELTPRTSPRSRRSRPWSSDCGQTKGIFPDPGPTGPPFPGYSQRDTRDGRLTSLTCAARRSRWRFRRAGASG